MSKFTTTEERPPKKTKHSTDNLVRVQLIDFEKNFPSILVSKFKSKRKVPFSAQFQQIDTVLNLKNPFDVKICHGSKWIIVSDHGNDRIQFYDLMSRKLVKSVPLLTTPVYIDVVENDESNKGGSSLLVSCCDGHVYKYNLLEMVKNEIVSLDFVWKSERFDGPAGLKYNCGVVYICDPYLKFTLLKLSDGSILEQVDSFGSDGVWNVDLIDEFTLLLTNQDEQKLVIVKKVDKEWKTIKTISQNHTTYWSTVFDTVSHKLVSVNGKSIVVMDLEGNIESMGDISFCDAFNSQHYTGGCILNQYTGELLFAGM